MGHVTSHLDRPVNGWSDCSQRSDSWAVTWCWKRPADRDPRSAPGRSNWTIVRRSVPGRRCPQRRSDPNRRCRRLGRARRVLDGCGPRRGSKVSVSGETRRLRGGEDATIRAYRFSVVHGVQDGMPGSCARGLPIAGSSPLKEVRRFASPGVRSDFPRGAGALPLRCGSSSDLASTDVNDGCVSRRLPGRSVCERLRRRGRFRRGREGAGSKRFW